MTYQAFYRVYRPQSFREMSGQTHVKRTLQNALLTNKTTHAYLFSGPRGTGKTSTARIFAKALNCEKAPTSEPCHECASCQAIEKGSNFEMDVFEFDAASNSRVEEMREVLDKVKVAPQHSKYKVYIIDEVHMLSTSAFNALLKTLEEPPEHVVFILATTEPHKLPATIISRCQRFDFKRLSTIDILERMKVVLEDIGLAYDEQALKVIAQAAAGGMRDALSLLDQVVSFSDEQLVLEDALLVTGSVSQEIFYDMTKSLYNKDVAQVLSSIDALIADGKEPLRLAEDLITFYRDLLLLQNGTALQELLELIGPEVQFIELAESISADTLYGYIDILAKTQQEMRFSHHTKIYLETALLKMAQYTGAPVQTSAAAIDLAIQEKVQQLENTVRQLTQQLQSGVVATNAPKESAAPRPRAKAGNSFNAPIGRIQEVLKDATKQDVQRIKASWAMALGHLQKSQAALLLSAEPVAASTSAFVVKFKYDIHCQMVADNKQLTGIFTQALATELGTVYEMLCIPEPAWQKVREEFIQLNGLNEKKKAAPVDASDSHLEPPPEDEPMFYDEAEMIESQDPIVVEAEKFFGKDIVEVIEE